MDWRMVAAGVAGQRKKRGHLTAALTACRVQGGPLLGGQLQ